MKTSEDEFTPGGGVAPPCTGSAADALPEVPCHHCGANSYTGVSTRNVSDGNGDTGNTIANRIHLLSVFLKSCKGIHKTT